MVLLLDIGNTHTHFGVWNGRRLGRASNVSTSDWKRGEIPPSVRRAVKKPTHVALCSVVPNATSNACAAIREEWQLQPYQLTCRTRSIAIAYPKPETIGPDRLANAVAASRLVGTPAVVVDFGTAVTFDVVDSQGRYTGGIIAPGLAAMTTYLHEKTALLPRIRIRDTRAVIGKSTREAMLIGAVHGYRGLVRELLCELKRELECDALPVIATGGYAALMARRLPEITSVQPLLTLEGLRLAWEFDTQPRRHL
jgi:type III pantothenate kinase